MAGKSKKHQHLVAQLARNVCTRNINRRFILSFEDSLSSPNYITKLLESQSINKESFVILRSSSGSDPKSVVDAAAQREEELVSGKNFFINDPDEVWIIIDIDTHEGISDALQRCRDRKYRTAISNPCFEYWLLLHFEDCAPSVINCSQMIKKYLVKHLPQYNKGKYDFTSLIDKCLDKALKNAANQHKAKSNECPSKVCPSTTFYELIHSIIDQS